MKKYSSTAKAKYRRTKHKSKYWLVLISVLIAFGWIFPWLITNVSTTVLYPLSAMSNWMRTSDSFIPEYLRTRSQLLSEVDSLRSEIATQSSDKNTVDRLMDENLKLRAMVNAETPNERLVARVVSRPAELSYDLLQIDRGSNDGIKVGAPVYTGLDSVLGVVVHVASNSAFVDLFTSPGFESTAYVIGPNVFTVLEGMGGGVARVNLPQGINLEEQQLVILPGVSNGVFGEIVHVENLPTQPQQYGYIAPSISLNELIYVSVGLDVVEKRSETEIDDAIRKSVREKFILDGNAISALEKLQAEAEAKAKENEEGGNTGENGGIETDPEIQPEIQPLPDEGGEIELESESLENEQGNM